MVEYYIAIKNRTIDCWCEWMLIMYRYMKKGKVTLRMQCVISIFINENMNILHSWEKDQMDTEPTWRVVIVGW